MATAAATVTRLRASRAGDPALALTAVVGAAICVIVTIALASGSVAGHGPAALAAAAFLLVAVWCVTHKRVDHTLVALALYLGLLDGYVKLRTGSSTVTLARDALVIAIAAGALLRTAQTGQRMFLPPLGGFVVAFSAVVLIEIANPSARGLTASLAGVRQHLEFVPLFFLGFAFVRTESQIRNTLLVLVFCAALGGVVSYVQSILTPEQLAGWGPGYRERVLGTGIFSGAGRTAFLADHATVRPFGLGSDMGAGAAAAALTLPGLVALLMARKGRARWAIAPAAVGLGLAVATSGSRTAIILVFVSLAAFALIAAASKNALKAAVGLTVGLVVICAAFAQLGPDTATAKRAQSITPTKALSTFSAERGKSVTAFGALAAEHPLGAGLGSVGPASGFHHETTVAGLNSETEWNFLVIEVGIAGVLVYVAFLLRLSWLSLTRIRHVAQPSMRLYLAAFAAPICGMLVAGFSGPNTASVPYAPFLWLASGVLAYWLITAYRHVGVEPDGQRERQGRLTGPHP